MTAVPLRQPWTIPRSCSTRIADAMCLAVRRMAPMLRGRSCVMGCCRNSPLSAASCNSSVTWGQRCAEQWEAREVAPLQCPPAPRTSGSAARKLRALRPACAPGTAADTATSCRPPATGGTCDGSALAPMPTLLHQQRCPAPAGCAHMGERGRLQEYAALQHQQQSPASSMRAPHQDACQMLLL